ncbi:MAG: superoxide dismutase family protein [Clostridia bacterium]|nr:superoxide dismutase family protein [Clostridia bacterium]
MSSPLLPILQSRPQAEARVRGSDKYPNISGSVKFYRTKLGTLIYAEIGGLPAGEGICGGRIFGFHIHEGSGCRGNAEDPFADAMTHYNPGGCAHPYHAGDLPPLFGNNGYALAVFLTNRFDVDEIIGRTVIIHSAPDDFTTQPSGNSGDKIACGEIRRI